MTTEERGSPAYDRIEVSPTSGYSRVEGTYRTPFKAGLFQNVTDVSWENELFTFAACVTANSGQTTTHIATSKNGKKWRHVSSSSFGGTTAGGGSEHGSGYYTSIHASVSGFNCILAGGFGSYSLDGLSGGFPVKYGVTSPAAILSIDGGKTFSDAKLPFERAVTLPTGVAGNYPAMYGECSGVGYDKSSKTFYAAGLYFVDFTVGGALNFKIVLYEGTLTSDTEAGTIGIDWSSGRTVSFTSDTLFSGPPAVPYPDGAKVNDRTVSLDALDPDTAIFYTATGDVDYVSANAPGQNVESSGSGDKITISGEKVLSTGGRGESGAIDRNGNIVTVDLSGTIHTPDGDVVSYLPGNWEARYAMSQFFAQTGGNGATVAFS